MIYTLVCGRTNRSSDIEPLSKLIVNVASIERSPEQRFETSVIAALKTLPGGFPHFFTRYTRPIEGMPVFHPKFAV
jgi:hypothetical protein